MPAEPTSTDKPLPEPGTRERNEYLRNEVTNYQILEMWSRLKAERGRLLCEVESFQRRADRKLGEIIEIEEIIRDRHISL